VNSQSSFSSNHGPAVKGRRACHRNLSRWGLFASQLSWVSGRLYRSTSDVWRRGMESSTKETSADFGSTADPSPPAYISMDGEKQYALSVLRHKFRSYRSRQPSGRLVTSTYTACFISTSVGYLQWPSTRDCGVLWLHAL